MNIGLIAHDSKKKLMQNFCIAYKGILNKNQLFATGTTGGLLKKLLIYRYISFLPDILVVTSSYVHRLNITR